MTFIGFIFFCISIIALIKGNLNKLKISNRKTATLLLLVSLVVMLVGLPAESYSTPEQQTINSSAENTQAETVKDNQDGINKPTDSEATSTSGQNPSEDTNSNVDQTLSKPGAPLEVHFIDVGQADAILCKLPNGQNIMIDAGNNADSSLVVNYLKKQNVAKVDHLIGTHPHEDHIGGLDAVINSFEIGKVYMPKVSHTSKTYKDVLLAIKNKNLKITEAKGGVSLDVGPAVNAVLVAPNNTSYEDLNNYSAVLKLTYGNTSFLFTGDAEEKSESEILVQYKSQIKADVLKVGHHGSNSSTSDAFLKAVSPKYAVIMVGKDNDYGHPHQETINKVNNAGIKIYRTDLQGTIIAKSNGDSIIFNTKPTEETVSTDTAGSSPSTSDSASTQEQDKPSPCNGIKITSIDLSDEIVTIKNTGNTVVDISGWTLLSVKGNQSYTFPAGTILQPEAFIKVVSGKKATVGPNTLVWTKKYIWNNSGDPGELHDATGTLVSEYK